MEPDKPSHHRLHELPAQNGFLLINGMPVNRIAEFVGQTPFYVYDRNAIRDRIAELRAALPDEVEIHYAIKANPMPAVIDHIRPLVDGFDCASQHEMLAALDSGMPAAEISFAGPGKRDVEIRAAVAAGICINCESETELHRIEQASKALGLRARVAIRVNPTFELKGSGMKMSGAPRQFGIDAERAANVIRRVAEADLTFEGLHIFCGSQNLKAEALIEANRKTLELAAGLTADTGQGLRFLNVGGGYGIPYFPNETALDVVAVGDAFETALEHFRDRLGGAKIVIELGRYIVGEAGSGYYVCRVTDIKLSQGHRFLVADGGLHHHLANSGNFGQVLRKNYPVLLGNRVGEPFAERMSIVGPLCTPLDLIADNYPLPAAAIGDLVVVLQSGAYGYSASPHRFLSHPEPVEILI